MRAIEFGLTGLTVALIALAPADLQAQGRGNAKGHDKQDRGRIVVRDDDDDDDDGRWRRRVCAPHGIPGADSEHRAQQQAGRKPPAPGRGSSRGRRQLPFISILQSAPPCDWRRWRLRRR